MEVVLKFKEVAMELKEVTLELRVVIWLKNLVEVACDLVEDSSFSCNT